MEEVHAFVSMSSGDGFFDVSLGAEDRSVLKLVKGYHWTKLDYK